MQKSFIVLALWLSVIIGCGVQAKRKCFNSESREKSVDGPVTVHDWVSLEYLWPCDWVEQYYRSKGWFDPNVNILSGIDVYNDDVYVTVHRLSAGVPSGLNKVVRKNGKSLLSPYPDLLANEIGNCSCLQYPISVAIDPNTGYMYVIDVGRIGLGSADNGCPAKLVVIDINLNGALVRSHDFPESVVPEKTNFLNDIVLDYLTKEGSQVRYAYITETSHQKIVVFDFQSNTSWAFHHDSMSTDEDRVITVNGIDYPVDIAVDGIAIDPNFLHVYYCAVGSRQLYRIPTPLLRDPNGNFSAHVRLVGRKISNSDGIVFGKNSLYYGALSLNAVYRWDVQTDLRSSNINNLNLVTETRVAQDDVRGRWVESLKLDTNGYLWFTTSRIHEFLAGTQDTSGRNGANFRINRVYVGENTYLWKRN
ncbi:hypothetical protein Btru_074369 [Bulinus truncatus]|nr:hypothetical protein Btru_074369 [Bulinus truncatus]